MRAALDRAGAEAARAGLGAASATTVWAPRVLAGAVAALVAAAVFAGGGSSDDPLLWIGGGALVAAFGAVAAAAAGAVAWPRPSAAGAASIALLAAFVLWSGATVLWSIEPDRSWSYFNRGLAYLAFLVLGVFLGALAARAATRVAAALALVVAAALAWALAGKFVPALYPDGGRIARLRAPVEYWNSLALLFALALPLALWIATGRDRRDRGRVAGVVLLYALVVGILLTYSRGGVGVAIAVVAAWLLLGPVRIASAAAVAAAVPLGIAVGAWAFGQPGVAADATDYDTRVRDGAELAAVFAAGALAAAALAYGLARLAPRLGDVEERLRRYGRALVAAVAVAAVALAALTAVVAEPVGWLDAQAAEFKNPPTLQVQQDPTRLTSVSSNNRWTWWQEAWRAWKANPLEGTGAGTFELSHRLLRENSLGVSEPHNVALQFLSETGLVGALLAGGATVAGLIAAAGAARRSRGDERGAAVALGIGVGAYVLHSLVDWNWDFVAVTAPVLVAAGVLFSLAREQAAREPRRLLLVGAAALLLAALSSLAAPWLAERRVEDAYGAVATGDAAAAVAAADEAAALNPLAVDPLVARADAQTLAGDVAGARASLVRAVELQPLNPDTWHALAHFEFKVANRPEVAYEYARRSWELDHHGPVLPLLAELETTLNPG